MDETKSLTQTEGSGPLPERPGALPDETKSVTHTEVSETKVENSGGLASGPPRKRGVIGSFGAGRGWIREGLSGSGRRAQPPGGDQGARTRNA